MKLKIGNFKLSNNSRPIFVAEISGNHCQSLPLAKKLLDSAKKSGADFAKLQLYEPMDMTLNTINKEFIIKDPKSPWYKKSLYEVYKKSCTHKKFFKKVFSYAKKIKLPCFSSIFNPELVSFLENLGVPAYKISSFEINHIPLIEEVSKTKKPIIFSTGVASYDEIKEAIKICKKNGNKKIIILHCSSEYPAALENCNLNHIMILKKKFKCLVGFSDHTKGLTAPLAAIAKGAVLIEKHYKLNQKKVFIDGDFSMTPEEFKSMTLIGKKLTETFGKKFFSRNKSTNFNAKFKRSIYISKNSKQGEKLSGKNLSIIRSIKGLHPREFNNVLNKRFTKNVKMGIPLQFKHFK